MWFRMSFVLFSITDSTIIYYNFECFLAQVLKFILPISQLKFMALHTCHLDRWQWAQLLGMVQGGGTVAAVTCTFS